MTRDELAARLLHTFLEELEEQVRVLNSELLALEREGPDAERVSAVFRVAHTLKGAARATRLMPIEELCHAMEAPLGAARDGRRKLTADDFTLLFAAADALSDAGERLRRGEPVDTTRLSTLARRFAASGDAAAGSLATPAFGTSPTATKSPAPAPPRVPDETGDRSRAPAASDATPDARAPHEEPVTRADDQPHEAAGDRAHDRAHEPGDGITVRAETQVRVRAEKLDDLLAAAGEMMLAVGATATLPGPAADLANGALRTAAHARRAAGRLRQALERAGLPEADRRLLAELADETTAIARMAQEAAVTGARAAAMSERAGADLIESVRRLRLRPFREATEALPRVVRDLASEMGKEVALRVDGGGVEADRSVLDGLREALLQLVRNAVDHGIERPDARREAGKPPEGTITVGAALAGQRLRVTVRDDGAGIDYAAAAALARRLGRTVPSDPQALVRLLFESGTSTRDTATEISGRGVGLDIVRTAVRRLRGTIQVESTPGRGTVFVIETPLTLATQRAMLVDVSGRAIGVPTTSIAGLRLLRPGALREVEGRMLLPTPDGAVPVVAMASALGPPLVARELDDPTPAVIVEHDGERLALTVDALQEETELVIRPLDGVAGSEALALSGAALLPSGQIALVVSVPALLQRAMGTTDRVRVRDVERAPVHRILVVDDSITTRTLEQSVLQAAGFEVLTAVDGRAALELLQDRGADLVLTDLEMPVMDGYELCEAIRSSSRFANLPVVLVTSLESPEQRRRGLEVGADAYIVKSSFDQEELLETVRQLLGRGAPA